MIQNAQFTDPERNKFFFPANYEIEIHPSVDLGPHPTVVELGIKYPLLRAEKIDGSTELRLPKGMYDQEFMIKEGERVRSIEASTHLSAQYVHRHEKPRDEPAPEDKLHAVKTFLSLTHMIIGVDGMRPYSRRREDAIIDSGFGKNKHMVLPIDDAAPVLSDENDTDSLEYKIKGFVDNKDRMVTVRGNFASWLVDMCVVSAHAQNNTELLLLDRELGFGRSLVGTLSTHPEVHAYLEHYAQMRSGSKKYIPTIDPQHRLDNSEFESFNEDERSHYGKLSRITYYSHTNPRESLDWSIAD